MPFEYETSLPQNTEPRERRTAYHLDTRTNPEELAQRVYEEHLRPDYFLVQDEDTKFLKEFINELFDHLTNKQLSVFIARLEQMLHNRGGGYTSQQQEEAEKLLLFLQERGRYVTQSAHSGRELLDEPINTAADELAALLEGNEYITPYIERAIQSHLQQDILIAPAPDALINHPEVQRVIEERFIIIAQKEGIGSIRFENDRNALLRLGLITLDTIPHIAELKNIMKKELYSLAQGTDFGMSFRYALRTLITKGYITFDEVRGDNTFQELADSLIQKKCITFGDDSALCKGLKRKLVKAGFLKTETTGRVSL